MKKKVLKKALALFVALSLCVSSVPVSVFAAEADQSAEVVAAASEDEPAEDSPDAENAASGSAETPADDEDADSSAEDSAEVSAEADTSAQDADEAENDSGSGEAADEGSVKVSAAAASGQSADLSKYLTKVTMTDLDSGNPTSGIEVSLDDPTYSVMLTLDFTLPTLELYTGDSYETFVGTATYTLPSYFDLSASDYSGELSGNLEDSSGAKIGTYEIAKDSGSWVVTLTFDQSMGYGTEIKGSLHFWADLNLSGVDENGAKVTLDFGNNQELTIPVEFEQDVSVSKDAETDTTTVETGSSITTTYTATVKTEGTCDEDIAFTDTLSYVITYNDGTEAVTVTSKNYADYSSVVSLTYGTATVTWYDEDDTQKEKAENVNLNASGLSFSLSLPDDVFTSTTKKLESGDYFVITYDVTCAVASSASDVESVTYSNKASGECPDSSDDATTETPITVTPPSDNFLTKTGTYNETENTYSWTITINGDHENMAEELGIASGGNVYILDYLAFYNDSGVLTNINTKATGTNIYGYVSAITFSLYDSSNQKQGEYTLSRSSLDGSLSSMPGIILQYTGTTYNIVVTPSAVGSWTNSSYSLVIEYEFDVSFFSLSVVEDLIRSGYELFNYVKITKGNDTLYDTEAELPGGPITVTKEGEQSEVTYNDDGTADISVLYSIKVSAPAGTSDSVEITDSGTLAVDTDSIRVIYYTPDEVSTDGKSRKIAEYFADTSKTSTLSDVTLTYSVATPGKFTLTLPAMAPGTYYLIYYTAVYKNATLGQQYTGIENGVTAEVLDNSTYRDSASCNVELIAYPFIEKTGVYNTETGKIDWTITINENRQDWRDYIDLGFLGDAYAADYYIYLEDVFTGLTRDGKEVTLYLQKTTTYDVTYTYGSGSTKTYTGVSLGNSYTLASISVYGYYSPNVANRDFDKTGYVYNFTSALNVSSNITLDSTFSITITFSTDTDWDTYESYDNTAELLFSTESSYSKTMDVWCTDTAEVAVDLIEKTKVSEKELDEYYYKYSWTLSGEKFLSQVKLLDDYPLVIYWLADALANPTVVDNNGELAEGNLLSDNGKSVQTDYFPMIQWYTYDSVSDFMTALEELDSIKDHIDKEYVQGYTVEEQNDGTYIVTYYENVLFSEITRPDSSAAETGPSGTYNEKNFYITGFTVTLKDTYQGAETDYIIVTDDVKADLQSLKVEMESIAYLGVIAKDATIENKVGVKWTLINLGTTAYESWTGDSGTSKLGSSVDVNKETEESDNKSATYSVQYDLEKMGVTAVDYTLTDTLDYSEYADYISGVTLESIKLYEYNTTTKTKGDAVTLTKDGTTGVCYTFTDSDNKAVITLTGSASGTQSYLLEYTYSFTYTSKALEEGWSGTLKNTATLSADTLTDKTDTSTVPLDAGTTVEKTASEYDVDSNRLSYQVDINTSEQQLTSDGADTLDVTDTLDYSGYTDIISGVRLAEVKLYLYDETKTDGIGDLVTITEAGTGSGITYSLEDNSGKAVLTLKGLADKKGYVLVYAYELSYSTMNEVEEFDLTNTALVTTPNGTAYGDSETTAVSEPEGISKDSDTYDSTNQTITYTVNLNEQGDTLNAGKTYDIEDVLDYSKYTDELSGIDLYDIHLYYADENGDAGTEITLTEGSAGTGVTYSFTDANHAATLTLSGLPDGKALVLEYTYQLSFATWNKVSALKLANTVSVTTKGVTGSADDTYSGKTGEVWSESWSGKEELYYSTTTNTLWYALTVNEGGTTVNGGNDITVTDTLNYENIASNVDSITVQATLYQITATGAKVYVKDETDASWWTEKNDTTASTLTLEFTVPDGGAYYIKYGYTFEYSTPLTTNARKSVSNEASVTLSGASEAIWAQSVSASVYRLGSGASAGTSNTQMTLQKVDTDTPTTLLPGATYSLERYIYEAGSDEAAAAANGAASSNGWVSVGSFTTGEDGTVELGEVTVNGEYYMRYNYLYRLKETSAPEGYAVDGTTYYIYIADDGVTYQYYPADYDPTATTPPDTLLTVSDEGTVTVSDSSIKSVSYTFGGVKSYRYDDAEQTEIAMTEGQFTFVSENISWPGSDTGDTTYRFDSTSADGTGKRTATNSADGSFSFDAYEFTTAGTWVFEITEQDDSATYDYIEYNADGKVYTVTVVVEQTESTDTVYTIASVTVNDGSKNVYTYDADDPDTATAAEKDSSGNVIALTTSADGSGIAFTNLYTAEAELDLVGTKSFGLTMADGQFTFEAAEAKKDSDSGEYVLTGRTFTGSSDADGNISFEDILYGYADIGEYQYTITETVPGDAESGILYDTSEIVIYVSVADEGAMDGELAVTVTDAEGAALDQAALKEAVAFTNDYTKVRVRKTDSDGEALSGAVLQLLDSDGEVVEEWETDGTVHEIDCLEVGVYTLHEASAPEGYALADDIKVEVMETGTAVEVEMVDALAEVEAETPEDTGTDTDTETSSTQETDSKAGSVQTGDDTPLMMWLCLLIVSLGGLLAVVCYRKRRSDADK